MTKQTETMRVHKRVKKFLEARVVYPESIGDTLARILNVVLGDNKDERTKKTIKKK